MTAIVRSRATAERAQVRADYVAVADLVRRTGDRRALRDLRDLLARELLEACVRANVPAFVTACPVCGGVPVVHEATYAQPVRMLECVSCHGTFVDRP